MDELQRLREELNAALANLQGEVEMGTITGDQEMIDEANKGISEINKRIEEIDQKIEEFKSKESKKKELLEKYPNQYKYQRIMALDDGELIEIAKLDLDKNQEKKAAIEASIAALEDEYRNLETKLEFEESRKGVVKEQYKLSHDPALLAEARDIVAEQDKIKEEMAPIEAKLAAMRSEVEGLSSEKIRPEDVRQQMIDKLDGKYKKLASGDTAREVKNKQAEGKSMEEIVDSLNKHSLLYTSDMQKLVKNPEELLKYVEIYRNITSLKENMYVYGQERDTKTDEIQKFKDYIKTLIDDPSIDAELKEYCETTMEQVDVYMNDQSFTHYKFVNNHVNMLKIILAGKMVEQLNLSPQDVAGFSVSTALRAVEDYSDMYMASRGKEYGSDTAMMKELLSNHQDDADNQMRITSSVLSAALEKASEIETRMKNSATRRIVEELRADTGLEPGQYTVEAIEKYLDEYEFVSEIKEEAERDTFDAHTWNRTNEEIAEMLKETQAVPVEEKTDSIVY